ncbi:hypothetical protein DFO67_11474 [Modicisalibacter xianhensis]|uniref:Uncharacterized protein n=1 Tax=Modicisalibacter xianhensis TaxID=442341 RepID=A0A4R8FL29_9GAMM|nr:hypothetical protein [Halomonas xianhensis]TDX26990.1 hypothetical protein DFO67_11474 [Halomonas xianhensis]
MGRLVNRVGVVIGNALVQDMPAVKAHAERQQRINEAIFVRRLTHGMSEADSRLVCGIRSWLRMTVAAADG